MKRFFLLLGLLLFVSGAQATTSVPGCPLNYICVAPSGKTDGTDTANIQAAMNAGGVLKPPVYLTPGDYALCSQLTTAVGHDGVMVLGPGMVNPDPGQGGISALASVRLNLTSCTSGSTFTSGQSAFLFNSQMNTLWGFSIYGTGFSGGSGINLDCVQSTTGGQNIQFMTLQGCYRGVYLNGVSTSYSAFNQVNHIEHNIITFVTYGILCQITTGNGCTDNFFNNNHIDDINTAGIACLGGCGISQINNNRIEDGGAYGILISDSSTPSFKSLTINGNLITALTTAGIDITNDSSITMSGNVIDCTSGPSIAFHGTGISYLITASGNQTNGGCSSLYSVDSGDSIQASTFNDPPIRQVGLTLYANTHTASVIEPYTSMPRNGQYGGIVPVTPSGTTFTPALDGNARDFSFSFVANSTIAAPTYFVSGAMGWLVIGQDATGGRTTTWNAAYLNQPSLSGLTANTCTYVPYTMSLTHIVLGTAVQNVGC